MPSMQFVLLDIGLFNPLPDNKIFDWSRLKACADDKINVTKKLMFALGRVENIVGKGQNAGKQHLVTSIFSFSHNLLKRLLCQGP